MQTKIRIGCGVVAGLAIGQCVGSFALGLTIGWSLLVGVALAVVFALLALRFGDRFWSWLVDALSGIGG
jgi:hypothetical protein